MPRLCTLDEPMYGNDDDPASKGDGAFHCWSSGHAITRGAGNASWCGASTDARGNWRFRAGASDVAADRFHMPGAGGRALDAKKTMEFDTYSEDFNFGMTTFNSMPQAFLTIFQCITLEGWTDVMYQLQDATSPSLVSVRGRLARVSRHVSLSLGWGGIKL